MTRETQSKLLGEFYAEKKNILKLKGEDYANEDVLSNFKTAGANIGISAEQQCLSAIATKVARLGNLLSGKIPNNESISDSILDLSNYTDLLYCLVNEENANVPNEEPQTNRCENVKPKGIIQALKEEVYEPKVGDRFKDAFERIWEITCIKKLYYSLTNDVDGDMSVTDLSHEEFYQGIENGTLKKIN